MRAAKMKERPTFQLMCQTDVQSIYHMQMPRWLFSDPRYCEMSLDAKVTYTFLLNRFQLSRKNGWVNDRGEVFVIFPRKALAKELRICEQRVTAAFKKLVELKLVWEKRCGRGDANQIYLARVTPIEDPDYSCAPFITEDESEVRGSRTSDLEGLADGKPSAACQGKLIVGDGDRNLAALFSKVFRTRHIVAAHVESHIKRTELIFPFLPRIFFLPLGEGLHRHLHRHIEAADGIENIRDALHVADVEIFFQAEVCQYGKPPAMETGVIGELREGQGEKEGA